MMGGKSSAGAGSLDMLLDTMCNTFGGVCFIALMIAIISASLPPNKEAESDAEPVSEQLVVDKETARLTRERDELKEAIAIQQSFITTNSTKETRALSAAQFASSISSNAAARVRLAKEKLELEDKLAKLTTDIAYNTKEAQRLERLLKEMEERLGKPGNMKNRAVRTPVEREIKGYRPQTTVWMREGKLYDLGNESQVDCKVLFNGKAWQFTPKISAGYRVDDAFFRSWEYRQIINEMTGHTYLRIYSDAASFAQLCLLRDDLIARRKLYNWYWCEDETLGFVEGTDSHVQ